MKPLHRTVLGAMPIGEPVTAPAVALATRLDRATVTAALIEMRVYGYVDAMPLPGDREDVWTRRGNT